MPLHVALCGPATLTELQPLVSRSIESGGYPFPLLPILAKEYLSRGVRVTLITTASDISAPQHFDGPDFHLTIVPSRRRARDRALDLFRFEASGIADALRTAEPDVIHAHWTYEFARGALDAGVSPTLVTAHDAPVTVVRHLRTPYFFARLLLALRVRSRTTHLTAVSPYLAGRWRSEMRYRGEIDVISNPVPGLPIPAQRMRRPFVILEVADGSRRKNVKTLLRSFAIVKATVAEAELRLVGPGLDQSGAIAMWAVANHLDRGVNFVGSLDRIALAQEYASASVFCHASLEESQGMTLLEALHFELPIVAGINSGAVAWTLFDGRAGLLADVTSPAALAAALISCLHDPSLGRRGGDSINEWVAERFGIRSIADEYIASYRRLVSAAREAVR